MGIKRDISFCSIGSVTGRKRPNRTGFYKHLGNFRWRGVRTAEYKKHADGWADVVRMVLVGDHNASTRFHLRYFEIGPDGFSSLERHRHEHVVTCIRGNGEVVVGRRKYRMGFLDTLYIPPDTPHQLKNPFDEPFGFFCIVNARRDEPEVLKS